MNKKEQIRELLYQEQFKDKEETERDNDDFSWEELERWMRSRVDNILK